MAMAVALPNNKSFTNGNDNHLEIFSLIWLCAADNNEDCQNTEQKLRTIINHFKKFQDVKECEEYVKQRSKQDRLVLIISDELGQEIVPSVHKLRQVSSIYVYCKDKKGNEQWSNRFAKGVVVEIDELVSQIKADHKVQEKEEEPLSMNMFTTGKSTTGINDQFEKLNAQLLQCAIDLNLGINLEHTFDRKQDELDQRNDLNTVQDKLHEIASMMVRQQQEQLHHLQGIEKHIKQRYNSYKHHLEQNIIRANDSVKAKKLINEEHSFLQIPYYDLIQEENIGQGGFADVYRGRWLSQDVEVAIKVIRIQYLGERVKEDFIKEISTMNRIRYEHILNMFGGCMEPEKYALVVEYMSLGSLHDVLKQKTIQLTWSARWLIAFQMTKGINYLHTLPKPIIHRDIKSHNVLMTESAQGFLVKIGDFGLAKIRHETSQQPTHGPVVGTLPWKAPELLRMGKHTEASDIYALGIVFWELATGCEPYEDADDATISAFVRGGDRLDIPADTPELSWINPTTFATTYRWTT
ncbi:unnamed protein product [Rotaria sp. Silwood2]|nr:unnamed protein product [Rotaria sp. Silwood2]CAF4455381.1 unnamed protein product [Rotaria sp. Silwood2]